ncbi:MAG: phage tail protein I [Selenomonadaceae bacterium]|nr:phage tail protein I [Selenomonadaceae bacterium]
MQSVYNPSLINILPASLLDDKKFFAVAKALDNILAQLSEDSKQTVFLPRLDELGGKVLDLLAWQLHVDNYEPLFLDDDTKRKLIRDSIQIHRTKGTACAVKTALADFDFISRIEEWFSFGGIPYTFRISVSSNFAAQDNFAAMLRTLRDTKNVRSHPTVCIEKKDEQFLYPAIITHKYGTRTVPAEHAVYFGTFVGIAQYRKGKISIGSDDIVPPAELTAFVGIAQYRKGRISIDPDDGIIVIPSDANQVTIYFKFPSGQRQLTLNNPREDLTGEDIQEVGRFAADESILINSKGEYVLGAEKYALVQSDKPRLWTERKINRYFKR